MDEKNNLTAPEKKPNGPKNPATPINSFSPAPDPIKFSSPFSPTEQNKPESTPKNPVDSLPKTDPVKDSSLNFKTDASGISATENPSLDSIKTEAAPAEKKTGSGIYIAIAIILAIAASIITGVLVYSWQSSLRDPLQKENALLKSQAGNLQSQVETLTKDKAELQNELNNIPAPTAPTETPGAPATPSSPAPETETPPTPETQSQPVSSDTTSPTTAPTPHPRQ